jgi:predicted permease
MIHAFRAIYRHGSVSVFLILTLAIGIGSATSMFSIVDGVLLRALPYEDPSRLYVIQEFVPRLSNEYPLFAVNARHFKDWADHCAVCEQMALVSGESASFSDSGQTTAERVGVANVTAGLFSLLGAVPQEGRLFEGSVDSPRDSHLVVISNSFWRDRLHARADVVGHTIDLDGQPYTVVGVLKSDFHFPRTNELSPFVTLPERTDIFRPLVIRYQEVRPMGNFNYAAIVRLRRGVTKSRAVSEMNAIIAPYAHQTGYDVRAVLTPLDEMIVGKVRPALWLLLAGTILLLAIVWLNVSTIILARAIGSSREVAIRYALGASQLRLLTYICTEPYALVLCGSCCGALISYAGIHVLTILAPSNLPRLTSIRVDWLTVVFFVLITMMSGMVCSSFPLVHLRLSNLDLQLKESASSLSDARSRSLVRSILVWAEVTLATSMVFLVSVLTLSFINVVRAKRGFQVDHILTAEVYLPKQYRDSYRRTAFYDALLQNLRHVPGVSAAGIVSKLPLKGENWVDDVTVERGPKTKEKPVANYRFISPAYLQALGISIIVGRDFTEADRALDVVIVSENAAKRLWPDENPIGRRIQDIWSSRTIRWATVIGVAADIRTVTLEKDPVMIVYVPYWESPPSSVACILRSSLPASALSKAIRIVVRNTDPNVTIDHIATMQQVFKEALQQRSFETLLAIAISVVALLLACLGLYGIVSHAVAQRTKEFGIRMTLGATPTQIMGTALSRGAFTLVLGVGSGVALSLVTGTVLGSLVYKTSPRDPILAGATALLLLMVGAAALYFPARRAARIDASKALHYE